MSTNIVNIGALKNSTNWGEYNQLLFIVQQQIAKIQTATLVKVISCTNDGDNSPVGMVNVQPLVNQMDGSIPANPTPHGPLSNLPYLRLQGGANGIICDPQGGDIGIAVFCSRDISLVKTTKAQGNPGSYRQYSFSDGLYLGGLLNLALTQFIRFSTDGIEIIGSSVKVGETPQAVVIEPFIMWVNETLLPALKTAGITVQPPPASSLTTVFEAT